MKRCGWTDETTQKIKNTWKLKKDFPGSIKSIVHDGNEMNITIYDDIKSITEIRNQLKHLNIKMYCIKRITGEILANERGIKCSK